MFADLSRVVIEGSRGLGERVERQGMYVQRYAHNSVHFIFILVRMFRQNTSVLCLCLYLRFFDAAGGVSMQPVQRILVSNSRSVEGVVLEDGTEIRSKLVLSNATAKVTYIDLLDKVYTQPSCEPFSVFFCSHSIVS